MHSVVPGAKLIYMVRDPLERIAAHWVHNYAKRREKGTLAETLVHPQHLLRDPLAVRDAARALPDPTRRSRCSSSSSPSFATSGIETLRTVFEFLGVDPDFTHPRFEQERHQTSGKTRATRLAVRLEKLGRSRRGRMLPSNFWLVLDDRLPLRRRSSAPTCAPRCRPRRSTELRADAERLRELTGRDFSNWKIWDSP